MDQKSKKRNPLLLGLVVLLGVTVLLCAATVGLWLHGRSAVNQEVEAPVLPQQEAVIPGRDTENLVEYQGKRYRYNENMRNILLMGIDSNQNPDSAAGEHDQADVVVLAALDLASDKMTLINLSRDTVCNIQVPDQNGELTRLLNTQLALSYAYGDGQYGSCEMTRDAVSNIFYGLPIQGYGAYYMNGIAQLNDAVGGVTVNVIDDFPFWALPECRNMLGGQDVTLTGEQAVAYIRCRLEEQVDANQLRMRRQKQYMLALIAKAKESVQENPATALTMSRQRRRDGVRACRCGCSRRSSSSQRCGPCTWGRFRGRASRQRDACCPWCAPCTQPCSRRPSSAPSGRTGTPSSDGGHAAWREHRSRTPG